MDVAEPKKAVNLTMPVALWDEFDRIASPLHGKQKWVAASAAMLALMEMPEPLRAYYMGQVNATDAGGSYSELIGRAKSGALRREAEQRVKPPAQAVRVAARIKRGEPD